MVPKPPGDAPITATGRSPNTCAISDAGRDNQSIAFLNTPGMPLLYSGVTSSRPSQARIFAFNACTASGTPSAASTSPSYKGMPRMDAISSSAPSPTSSAAARSSAVL